MRKQILDYIALTKRVYRQGERLEFKLLHDSGDTDMTVSLTGGESVDFNMQYLTGKRGFSPIMSIFLPSRHFQENQVFLYQDFKIYELSDVLDNKNNYLEVPENAIPSFFGKNSRVIYEVEIKTNNSIQEKIIFRDHILVDAYNENETVKDEIFLESGGKLNIRAESPIKIDELNEIFVSSENISQKMNLKIDFTEKETVKAKSIVQENIIQQIPIGILEFDEDFPETALKFKLSKEIQQSSEATFARIEHYVTISEQELVSLKLKRKKLKSWVIYELPIKANYIHGEMKKDETNSIPQ